MPSCTPNRVPSADLEFLTSTKFSKAQPYNLPQRIKWRSVPTFARSFQRSKVGADVLASLFALRHPHIVDLYAVSDVGEWGVVVCEYPLETLAKRLACPDPITWQDRFWVLCGVSRALLYLHSQKVSHGTVGESTVYVLENGTAKLFAPLSAAEKKFNSKADLKGMGQLVKLLGAGGTHSDGSEPREFIKVTKELAQSLVASFEECASAHNLNDPLYSASVSHIGGGVSGLPPQNNSTTARKEQQPKGQQQQQPQQQQKRKEQQEKEQQQKEQKAKEQQQQQQKKKDQQKKDSQAQSQKAKQPQNPAPQQKGKQPVDPLDYNKRSAPPARDPCGPATNYDLAISPHKAASSGNLQTLRRLLENGHNSTNESSTPEAYGDMPIHCAVRMGQLEVVKYLVLDRKCTTNKPSRAGHSLLYMAAEIGNADLVRFLLEEAGARRDIHRGRNMRTPLHVAALGCTKASKVDAVRLLMAAGSDIHGKDDEGMTPLHYAAFAGVRCVRVLVEAGAKVAVRDKKGRQPLHYAAWAGRLEAVTYLVEKCSASVYAVDQEGMDALKFATQEHRERVAAYLRRISS